MQVIALKPVAEQVMVVMGASSGIGREVALRAARAGARVVVAARDEEALASLVDEIEQAGGRASFTVADVADFEQVRSVAAHASAHYGGLDTWAHCSAVALYSRFEDTTPEEFRRVVEVNLLGQVHGAMAALPWLRERGQGALVHVSSIEARRAFPYHSAYSAAKHGIDGFLEALRIELHQEGVPISVTNVMPGSTNTPLFEKARTKLGVKPMPIPPIYQPGTVANLILHAAEHPARDLVAGGAGGALLFTQRVSPRILDAALLRFGFRTQRTQEPANDDDNLYRPVRGDHRSEGPFNALGRSAFNWVETHAPWRAVSARRIGPRRWHDSSEPGNDRPAPPPPEPVPVGPER